MRSIATVSFRRFFTALIVAETGKECKPVPSAKRRFTMKIIKLLPGIVLPIIVALLACWLESLLPIHLIGSAVIAMFIGMFLNQFVRKTDVFATGLKFTSKKILKFAIILLGLSLNITAILHVGQMSLTVMVFTLLTCFGGGYFIGKALGLNWKLSNLISAGTGICGGSAIAAIAPTIDSDDNDVAYAMSATFLFDMAMIVLFPIMGRALGMTDQAFGIWAGTAVNDTSSVMATGYAFSEAAGDFATMVKLTRTLAIIPTVIVFALVQLNLKRKEAMALQQDGSALKAEFSIKKIFPWFILGFLAMSIVASILPIPAQLVSGTKTASKFLMVCALAAIGLNTSFASMKKAGIRPMIHGFIISALVVIVALLVDDAILNFRLGKYSPNRRRESRQVIRADNENVLHASFFSPLSTVAQYLALSFSPTHIPNTSFLRAQRTYPCSLFFSFSCYGLSGQQPHQIACKAIVFSKKA